jgi:Transposase, Mutator family
VKAGIGKEKAALLVVIGVKWDGTKRFLALESGYRESKESWSVVLRELKRRGVKTARLFVGNRNLGLWAAVGEILSASPGAALLGSQDAQRDRCCEQKEQVEVKRQRKRNFIAHARHTFITEQVKRGELLKAIAGYCGTSVVMIEQDYCGTLTLSDRALDQTAVEPAASKFAALLASPTGFEPKKRKGRGDGQE